MYPFGIGSYMKKSKLHKISDSHEKHSFQLEPPLEWTRRGLRGSPGTFVPTGLVLPDVSVPVQISKCRRAQENQTSDEPNVGITILDWILILALIALSALLSGLTRSLMSLDKTGLEIVIGGEPDSANAKYARKILPVRANGNLLLCTLLLGNTLVTLHCQFSSLLTHQELSV